MRHAVLTLGLAAGLAAPATAQWVGVPVWNSPEGGGLVVSADYAKPNTAFGGGSTWGVRFSWGRGTLTFTAGATSWQPGAAGESLTSIGGNAALRLNGGAPLVSASPGFRANLQLGFAHSEVANVVVSPISGTSVTGAVGFGARLAAPNITVEPYFSPGLRYRGVAGGANSTEFGYAIGANVGFGRFGVHLAYDNEQLQGGGNVGVIGVGAHVAP